MAKVKTATFNGRRYKIDIDVPADGQVDAYKMGDTQRFIYIQVDEINSCRGLTTLIHEFLHAENWAETEDVVDRVSTEIGRTLWRMGWRLEP